MSRRTEIFQDILNEYESDEIRDFCIDILEGSPQNFWSVATEAYDFAGGLITQTLVGCKKCNRLISDCDIDKPKKRDCVRAATLFRYLYPDVIIKQRVEHDIKKGLKEYIAKLIKDYLDAYKPGESTVVLASHSFSMRESEDFTTYKWINNIKDVAVPNPENYFFPQGTRYQNMNWWLVYQMDKDYLRWLKNSMDYVHIEEPLRSYLEEYL